MSAHRKAVRYIGISSLMFGSLVHAQRWQTANDFQRSQPVVSRESWQARGRHIPGANSAALRRHALAQKFRMRALRAANSIGVGAGWRCLGPLPLPSDASGAGIQDYGWVSGRATSVAVDPNDLTGNTVFVGAAYGGVWKSTNAGSHNPIASAVTWTPLTDSQATLAIGSVAIQPQLSNPNAAASVVLAGTGETNSSVDSYYGLGILRSADGGQTWTLVSQDSTGTHSFAGLGFSRIAFSTSNPNVVVAGAASASQGILEGLESPVGQNRGIYFSSNAGSSWMAATIADSGVAVSPASVTSVAYNAAAARFFAAVRFHGFYSSPDGANWTRLAFQPGGGLNPSACPAQSPQSSSCPIYRGEIAIVPNRAGPKGLGEMYVWYVDSYDGDQGMWKSLDGGTTWAQVNDSAITNCGDLFGGCGTVQGKYNLALAAVPNGTATDLYAGATNLYKCTITNAYPFCNGSGNNTFLNLTHVYGCSDLAQVHPNQHAIDFLVSNSTALLYFANDGGIYRALDGFMGLRSGTCGQPNQFGNLNANLGPITQFTSLSQSSTDPDLILGGSQDNGAPATAYSQSGGPWVNVNAGENGFTAINPANDSEWFLAVPPDAGSGVNILRCRNGINCHTLDFQNGVVADGNALGGDTGPFYPPFMLDPQSSGTLLAGTCRVWRGASSGGSFTLLSPNFESGGNGTCSGAETNTVRSLAAGGPTDDSGYSQVIYAGTDGDGPLIPTSPQGGHLWVSFSSDSGPAAWMDNSNGINPFAFPISAIAVDSGDTSGQTAYAAIMGFHTAHLWQTQDAGFSWTDFTANLPDVPVNAIALDPGPSPGNGTLYVATDIGVFGSSSGFPAWNEVGPAPNQPGFLPNATVTSLQIFNSGGLKRLRAGTYGRGIWEWNLVTTPDFQLAVSNNPQTVFAGQQAAFNGTIWARNGYNNSVSLNCAPGTTSAPQNCSATPASLLPAASGTAFAMNASDAAGDYVFNLQAVGTDSATVTHTFPLTLHVIDFMLGAPAPTSVSATAGGTTSPISLRLSAAGGFNAPVSLACAGLPIGASCQFQPSGTATPTSANPVSMTLMISTTSNTPPGTSQITISASTAGASPKTQTVSLTVGAVPDYTLAIANPSLTAQVNASAAFNGTLTSVNGYSSAVAMTCGNGAPATCTANPSNTVPTAAGVPFTVTVSSSVAQSYAFKLNAVGSDASAIAHSAAVTFTSLPNQGFDFTMGATPSTQSVAAGKTATYTVAVNPNTGSFPKAVNLTCSGAPAATTCTFTPSQIGAGSGNSVCMLTASTTAPGPPTSAALLSILLAPLAGIFWTRGRRPGGVNRTLCLALLLSLLSCGGGLQGNGGGGSGNPGTPLGTYNLTITATAGTVIHTTQVSLTVTR
ncbi:MAG TPA: hypothetical protein VF133_16745 [Terriglobales bacterium]